MAIPKYDELTLPILRILMDNEVHTNSELLNRLVLDFKLTEEESNLKIPNRSKTYIYDRFHWAKTYLRKAKLIESPSRSEVVITERGRNVLIENPQKIDKAFLMKFEEFANFAKPSNSTDIDVQDYKEAIDEISPEEMISISYERLKASLADDLLEKIKESTPAFFENLVVDLLVKMGYGGSIREAGQVIGRSNDGGIDGVIKEDRLGLDKIFLQAKRWSEGTVGRPQIQAFVGALAGVQATKGIFITTSNFSEQARLYVQNLTQKIVLIDGIQLAELMIEFNVGVSTKEYFEIKQIDVDYFEN